jgi:hypothetical protein
MQAALQGAAHNPKTNTVLVMMERQMLHIDIFDHSCSVISGPQSQGFDGHDHGPPWSRFPAHS